MFKIGKHKGKKYTDVEESYLVWYYENVDNKICTKKYYEFAKNEVLKNQIEHECIMESLN